VKILITGSTGFVGSYVLNELLKSEHDLIATSSKTSVDARVRYKPLDLNTIDNSINYFDYFDRPDLVIHLAWQGLPNYKSLFHFEENLPAHYAFVKNMVENGLKHLTITGTCLEYGMKEGELSEDMVADPQNAYALAKDSLRKFIVELQKFNSFDLKWVRLFYMYGKGQNPNSLLSQLEKAIDAQQEVFNMSGGEQLRDYLPVEKVAEIIVKVALQQQQSGVINCCSGKPVSVKDLVQQYLKQNGKEIKLNLGFYPYTDYEPMAFWGSTRKLNTILDNE
jgi:nucleoside-diphosphate-sugar epimerase